jgi:hypothetical protein
MANPSTVGPPCSDATVRSADRRLFDPTAGEDPRRGRCVSMLDRAVVAGDGVAAASDGVAAASDGVAAASDGAGRR